MRVRHTEIAQFAQDLAGLLGLGYSLEEAVMKTQSVQSANLKSITDDVVSRLQKGESLAGALQGNSKELPVFARLVEAAEEGEDLKGGLERAGQIFEELADRRNQCFLVTLYPVSVMSVGTIGLWLLLLFCGDLLSNLFGSMNLALPLPTKVFMLLGDVAATVPGALLFLAPVVFAWMLVFGKGPAASLLYRVPLYGKWLLRQESVAFLSALYQLHLAGVPLPEAVRLATLVCPTPLQEHLADLPERLKNGQSLSEALRSIRFIPEIGLQALEHGESTEDLRLDSVAALVEHQLRLAAETRTLLFEPIFFFGLFAAVGFVILAVFVPIYQLIGNLG